jgi:aminopeptidase N
MVATNEFENSWMDEGFTQYMETRIMDEYYPKGSILNFFGFSVNDLALARDGYVSMQNPAITPIRENAWAYPKGTYGIMSYYKPATVLRTLQNILGEKTMDIVLKTYFERFKFKHPVPQDFFDVANEVASKHTLFADLNWFFDQTILTAKVCDYQAKNLVNNEGQGTFQLRNLKNMYLPVDVLVTFVDKSTVILKWDGKSRNISYKKEIVSVYIDPDKKNLMDINVLNNSISVKPPRTIALKYAAKIMFWMQNVLFWV